MILSSFQRSLADPSDGAWARMIGENKIHIGNHIRMVDMNVATGERCSALALQ